MENQKRYLLSGLHISHIAGLTPNGSTQKVHARYRLGSHDRFIELTNPTERRVIDNVVAGRDYLDGLPHAAHEDAARCISKLEGVGFLVSQATLQIPKRYLDQPTQRDASILQLRARSAAELHSAAWIDGHRDGGATTVSARRNHAVVLSGRSRAITLVHTILLASGCDEISFSDLDNQPTIEYAEIGAASIHAGLVGSNYYQTLTAKNRELSLFPSSREVRRNANSSKPALLIHDGSVTPYLLSEWMSTRTPHLIINPPVGDTIDIGPLVLPGVTPCSRCLYLHQMESAGFSPSQSMPLSVEKVSVDSLTPISTAHLVAGVISSIALNYLDQISDPIERGRDLLIGKTLRYRFSQITKPQVVECDFHPLCGCRD